MSQLQARRNDFTTWCDERGITEQAEKDRYWVCFSGGWEMCAARVYGAADKALSDPVPTASGDSNG